MHYEFRFITDDDTEAVGLARLIGFRGRMTESEYAPPSDILKGEPEPEPTAEPKQPHPILQDAAEDKPKAKRGRPAKPKPEVVADSKDPALLSALPAAAPAPAPAPVPAPTSDQVIAMVDAYQQRFGLAKFRDKLVEQGVNKFRELTPEAAAAFYAARQAELAAV